jgi:hypothetical protein
MDAAASLCLESAPVITRIRDRGVRALQHLTTTALAVVVAGCAARSVAGSPGETRSPAPQSTSEAAAAKKKVLDEITDALLRGDAQAAASVIERARQLPPGVRPTAPFLAYFDATVHAYRGDFRGAIQVMHDHIATVGPAAMDAFTFHDAMIALRTAEEDLPGALVECEEMVRAGMLGTWTPSDGDRITLVRLKEHWHRAYLLRMIAQSRTGAARQEIIGYAEAARRDYIALAAPLKTLGDSIAVLDAYFALCDGDRARMREAARRVNVAEDDDAEDLYLVQLALDGAGDGDAAAAVRARIAASKSVNVLMPVFLAWMRTDQATDQPPRFSPKNPAAPTR